MTLDAADRHAPEAGPAVPGIGAEAVLIPVKGFSIAKRRLGKVLSDIERRHLVEEMATRVLLAASPLPVAVVCCDPEVARWARAHGALVVEERGTGLNAAVETGVAWLAQLGVRYVTTAHADLPRAEAIGSLGQFDGVTIVPDRHDEGTNVLRVPVGYGFRFAYGPSSFARHLEESRRLGLEVRVLGPKP